MISWYINKTTFCNTVVTYIKLKVINSWYVCTYVCMYAGLSINMNIPVLGLLLINTAPVQIQNFQALKAAEGTQLLFSTMDATMSASLK